MAEVNRRLLGGRLASEDRGPKDVRGNVGGSMDAILDAFLRHARDRPNDLALGSRAESRRLSFTELAEQSKAWASRLGGERQPLALAVGNRTAFVEIFLAARRLGLAVVVMDGSSVSRCRELCHALGIRRLLTPAEPARPAVGRVAGRWQGVELTELDVEATEPPAGTALVKLTSGSTGDPLTACFTADSLAVGIRQIAEGMGITARDRTLLALPLSHSYGFDNGVLALLFLGAPLILEPSVFPADLLRAVTDSEATVLPLVPPLVRSLSAATWPASRLRLVLCAGGVLPDGFARDFHAASGLFVHNFYGSTETGGICFERRPEEADAAGTVGQPLPGVELHFDELGRVSVESAANSIGIFSSPRSPAKACSEIVRTGDLGELTSAGRLRLTGRVADLLNIGGRKIAAVEVETALRRLPGIADVAVVGVPDDMRGDRAVAFLVADHWPVDVSSLPARLRPRELHRVDDLPHNTRGKLDRKTLRARAIELSAASSEATNFDLAES